MATNRTRRRPVVSGRAKAQQPAANGHASEELAKAGIHTESENHPWTIAIPDHVGRQDSPEYIKSRKTMNEIAAEIAKEPDGLYYGSAPWQDHHGGALLLMDDQNNWFLVRNLVGMEWSSQFCADPAKVDKLRENAKRLYDKFPKAVEKLGIADLLNHKIETPEDVAAWVDSICNASVPLPPGLHTGVLPQAGGVHHYPAPIVEIALFKKDDFNLWVLDPEGQPAAVTPVSRPDSGDGRVQVEYSTPGTQLHKEHVQAQLRGEPLVLPDNHAMARQAFHRQYERARRPSRAAETRVQTPTTPVTEAVGPELAKAR